MEDIENKMQNREEILARIARDTVSLKGDYDQDPDKLQIFVPDLDDKHQQGFWSEDEPQVQEVDSDPDVVKRHLKDVKWSYEREQMIEQILLDNAFDFTKSADEFQRIMNRDEGTNTLEWRIHGDDLQKKWTEIEIRN